MKVPNLVNIKFKINLNKYTIGDTNENEPELQPEEDYVVKSMGEFGRWQTVISIVVLSGRLIVMWNFFSIQFLTPATKFVCKGIKNATESKCYDGCEEYEFIQDVFDRTLTSDFVLICDGAWMASLIQTLLMCGNVVGVGIMGWVADRFGRSKAIILSAIITVIFMISASFAKDYWTFIALRFFIGLGSGGITSTTVIYTWEIVGSKYREISGAGALIPDSIAEITLALFAYLAPTWNVFLWEFSGISVLITIALIFTPETPRWLMANGKSHKAVELMTKAAKCNKLSTSNIIDNVDRSLQAMNRRENESQKLTYLDMFKTRTMSIISVCAFIVCFLTAVCYWGLKVYMTAVGSNIFIVIALTGTLQLPSPLIATVMTKVYGRKAPLIYTYVVVGVTMFISVCLPNGTWVSIVFGMIGVNSIGVAICILHLFIIELYPTPIRTMGFSFASLGGKFGVILAYFVISVERRWVSSLILAILPFMAAAICLLLPETQNRKLRDTVDE